MSLEPVRVVYDYDREYRVLVARRPDEGQLETWRRGVVLEDGYWTKPAQVYEKIYSKRMEGVKLESVKKLYGCWLSSAVT